MNVALIGYRGTGKSAVSKLLAPKLNKAAVSLDDEIVKTAEMSIPQIVETHGWPYFRDLEQKVTERFCKLDNLVIDCGGGVILRTQNVETLQSNATLVWLKASPEVIAARIGTSENRPALVEGKTFLEEIEEVLQERTSLYKNAAQFSIDTDSKTPEALANEIATFLKAQTAS